MIQHHNVLLEKQSINKGQAHEKSEGNIRTQISAYQSAIRGLDEQKAMAYERFLDGDFGRDRYIHKKDTISKQQEELKMKMEKLEKELLELRQQEADTIPSVHELEVCLQAKELNREIVEAFVKCIYVYKDKRIRIEWLFEDAVMKM